MSGQEVIVTVRASRTAPDGDISRTDVTVPGILREKGGRKFLFYSEQTEDGSVTRSSVRYSRERMQITRSGAISSTLLFEERQHFRSSYIVPYGSFLIDIDTDRYDLLEQEDRTLLTIGYRLAAEGQPAAVCLIRMEIRKKESNCQNCP